MRSSILRLERFCEFVMAGQKLPGRKLGYDILVGMLASQSPIISRIADALDEDGNLDSTVHRLSNGLQSKEFNFDLAWYQLRFRYQGKLRCAGGAGVTVAVDGTDIQHPYADPRPNRGMCGVSKTRDGSLHINGLGFPCAVAEVDTPSGLRLPLALYPIDRTSSGWKTDKDAHLEAMRDVAAHVGSLAGLVFDRGYDDKDFFHEADAVTAHWVIRLKAKARRSSAEAADAADDADADGSEDTLGGPREAVPAGGRHVVREDGTVLSVREAVFAAPVVARGKRITTRDRRHGDLKGTPQEFRSVLVRVPDPRHPETAKRLRTLISVQMEGCPEVLVLLASEPLHTGEDIVRVFATFPERWRIEETRRHQGADDGWGLSLEHMRALKWTSTQRLCFFVAAAQCFVSELTQVDEPTLAPILALARTCADDPEDYRYRVCRGFGEVLRRRIRDERTCRARAHVAPNPRRRAWHSLFKEGAL